MSKGLILGGELRVWQQRNVSKGSFWPTTFGMVVRDLQGSVHLYAVTKASFSISPLHDEVEAILFGLKLMREFGFHLIIMESNSSLAIS